MEEKTQELRKMVGFLGLIFYILIFSSNIRIPSTRHNLYLHDTRHQTLDFIIYYISNIRIPSTSPAILFPPSFEVIFSSSGRKISKGRGRNNLGRWKWKKKARDPGYVSREYNPAASKISTSDV